MNGEDILIKQNEDGMIQIQKTAGCCYKRGKTIALIVFIFAVIFPVLGNVIIMFFSDETIGAIASGVLIVTIIISKILNKLVDNAKFNGACLQEYFDEYVLSLTGCSRKYCYPERITNSKRIELITKYHKKSSKGYSNWYSDYSKLEKAQCILCCQMENVRWDKKLRKRYKHIIEGLCSILVIFCIFAAIFAHLLVSSVILYVFSIISIFDYMYNTVNQLNDDIQKQNNILRNIYMAKDKLAESQEIEELIEELQIKIFEYRKQVLLLPDIVYKIWRNNDQNVEDAMAKDVTNNYSDNDETIYKNKN